MYCLLPLATKLTNQLHGLCSTKRNSTSILHTPEEKHCTWKENTQLGNTVEPAGKLQATKETRDEIKTEFNLQIFAVQKPPQPLSSSFLPYMSVNRLQTHFPVLGATLQPAPLPSFSFQTRSSCQGWGAGLLSRKECKQTVCAPSPGRPVRESGDSSEVTHSPTATPQRCCDPATVTSLLTAVGEKLQESSCRKCDTQSENTEVEEQN